MGSERVGHNWATITFPFMVFPVVIYGCESWTIKEVSAEELVLLSVVLEKTLESPLDCKEIQPVNPKGSQPWIFIGKTDAEAPILWLPDANNWLMEKTLMVGKIEGRKWRGWQRMRWLNGITDSMDIQSWFKQYNNCLNFQVEYETDLCVKGRSLKKWNCFKL